VEEQVLDCLDVTGTIWRTPGILSRFGESCSQNIDTIQNKAKKSTTLNSQRGKSSPSTEIIGHKIHKSSRHSINR